MPGTKNESLQDCINIIKQDKNIKRDCKDVYSDMIPFFCGSKKSCRKRDKTALEEAKNNIIKYYSAVGILEDMEGSFRIFEKVLPDFFGEVLSKFKDSFEFFKEQSKTKSKKESESQEVYDYLKGRLGNEIELYNFVAERMKQQNSL